MLDKIGVACCHCGGTDYYKQKSICAFICKKINGIINFAVQAKLECGNFYIIEFAPTVKCLTGNYRQSQAGALPFLEYVLNAK